MLTRYALSPSLSMQVLTVAPKLAAAPAPPQATDHILVVDVSGSMSGELPNIRQHLKTKIAKIMREQDTLSVVWFSGKGEYGTLLEATTVPSLRELRDVHAAIDRWLRPVGMTGFLEPVQEVNALVRRLAKPGRAISAFFLSDGCDNQWPREKVLAALKETKNVSSAVVVEYGYYADRAFLSQMAAAWGGRHIFANGFVGYAPALEAAVTREIVSGGRVEVAVGAAVDGVAVVVDRSKKEVIAYQVDAGKVSVPEGTTEVAYLVPTGDDDGTDARKLGHDAHLYGLISTFAPRVRGDLIRPLLRKTGDVMLIEQFANCFGKQAYTAFRERAERAAVDPGERLLAGYDPERAPREDAFTILDLLSLLSGSETARVDVDAEGFDYKRIGRTRVDSNTRLSDAEKEELDTLVALMSGTKDVKKLKELQEKVDVLTNKPEPLVFKENPKGVADRGYPLDGLVFNEDRPNVSFRVRREGTVDLSSRLAGSPADGKVPAVFPTYTFRNYTVIRDGIRNVDVLPVVNMSLKDQRAIELATKEGRLKASAVTWEAGAARFDLREIPIVNGIMVKRASAEEMFRASWHLLETQAALKVFKDKHKELFDKKAEGFAAIYGAEVGAWLAEQGIVSYSGFGPKSLVTESTDFYMAKVIEVKIKGYSALPKTDEVRERLAKKTALTAPGELMAPIITVVDLTEKTFGIQAQGGKDDLKKWLEGHIGDLTQKARKTQYELARTKFSAIVGGVWFTEFKTLDENSMTLKVSGKDVSFVADMKEVKEKI